MDKYIGQTFGIYTIMDKSEERTNDGHTLYLCKCNVCGNIFKKRILTVIRHNSCCLHNNYKSKNPRLYNVFKHMYHRCYNTLSKDYKWYGAKGIEICNEWLEDPGLFEQWAINNGYKEDLSIDRIDSTKNYTPENCRWIKKEENSRRAGRVNWITVNSLKLTGRQWSKKLGLGINAINKIVKKIGINNTEILIQEILDNPELLKCINNNNSILKIYQFK